MSRAISLSVFHFVANKFEDKSMAAIQISRNFSSISSFQRQRSDNLLMVKIGFHMLHTTSSKRIISVVRGSSKPQRGGPNADDDNKATLIAQEDLSYLVKLGGGSIAGAAAIKYGSVIFPEITRPNLTLALFMIFAPVVVAVLLLLKQSRVD